MEEAEVESCSLESSVRDVCRRGMACLPGLWPAAHPPVSQNNSQEGPGT